MKTCYVQGICSNNNKTKARFSYCIETKRLILNLDEPISNITNVNQTISIEDEQNNIFTFFYCILTNSSPSQHIDLLNIAFSCLIEGISAQTFEEITCLSMTIEIDDDYPHVWKPFTPKKFCIDNINLEICNEETFIFTFTPLSSDVTLSKIETLFFRLCDLFFICRGLYPKVKKQVAIHDKQSITIHHRFHLKSAKKYPTLAFYPELVDIIQLDLETIYKNYTDLFVDQTPVIDILTSALYSEGNYTDIILSTLIQCTEGYMNLYHSYKKFDDILKRTITKKLKTSLKEFMDYPGSHYNSIHESISGLLGKINIPNLKEYLAKAFLNNLETQKIVQKELDEGTFDCFINNSYNIRNRFSHMTNQKSKLSFSDIELLQAYNKYILLLRTLILLDLGISQFNLDQAINELYNNTLPY